MKYNTRRYINPNLVDGCAQMNVYTDAMKSAGLGTIPRD